VFGILLIDKPEGISSHDAVNRVRRRFETRRVGHAGTLDPLATGVLVVAVGPATRFLQYLPLEPKEYVGTIAFGACTTTLDREGEIVWQCPLPDNLNELLTATLPRFQGLIEQVPPMFSAIKKDGKPLYELARMGKQVERRPRRVHVETFEITSLRLPEAEFRVVCSGGTYVRTLANDLGKAVGCGAHLSSLKRTRVGRFLLESAVPLEEAGPADLIPLAEALRPMTMVRLDPSQVDDARMGRSLECDGALSNGQLAGLLSGDTAIGVARCRNGRLHPECVIPAEAFL